MKIKTLLTLAIASLSIIFIACNDDLNSTGLSIQPDGDGISVGADTLTIKAETVLFDDSIYARTVYGILGEYIDPIFGKIKSDYLCEFYCKNAYFEQNTSEEDTPITIDSVFLDTKFSSFLGDTISPMGVSVYEVTSSLKPFFFTNINPEKYCDMTKVLGQSIYTIKDLPYVSYSSTYVKQLSTELDVKLGKRFYKEWSENKGTFTNSETLKEFFKGVYVTTNFGTGSIINTAATDLNIYYTYHIRNNANTGDSAVVGKFNLPVTPEVIQMNRIKNSASVLEKLKEDKDTKTYLKTPAGVYTQITIPLQEIKDAAKKKMNNNQSFTINSAALKIKGYTEEETKSGLARPSSLLLINKDSLPNFFFNRKKYDNLTSFKIDRTTSNNTYNLGNIATIVNYYTDKFKDQEQLPDLHYLLIPISVSYSESSTSSNPIVADIYNMMAPTSAILRTDTENMRMSLIFSQYNSRK